MEYTYEQVQAAIEKQVDYETLALLLETDLNAIADQVIAENPSEDYIHFKVFFDSGEYDSTINDSATGEGNGLAVTPVLLRFINGDYSSSRGPQFFSTVFSIEVFGLEKDRSKLRKIFETYSNLNQGRIDDEEIGISTVKTLEFPYFEDGDLYKGSMRFQGFMRLFITYMYNGQMSNEVQVKLDSNDLILQTFKTDRVKNANPDQVNNQMEITNVYESQILTFSGAMLFDNSAAAILLLNDIKTLNQNLDSEHTLSVAYPAISATPDTYTVSLDSGAISVDEGGVITLQFVLTLAGV